MCCHPQVNVSTLKGAEEYSLGFASWLHDQWSEKFLHDPARSDLRIAATRAGTKSGLSKAPYIRDTRRAIGIGQFRLTSEDLSAQPSHDNMLVCEEMFNETVKLGASFHDSIALGDYLYFDTHGLTGCTQPDFPTLAPYSIPFRALTSIDMPNVLVAGKTMAQSYAANSATRLHPVEWSSGAAAGAAAVLMSEQQRPISTTEVYESAALMGKLRGTIQRNHAPLEWRSCPPPSARPSYS